MDRTDKVFAVVFCIVIFGLTTSILRDQRKQKEAEQAASTPKASGRNLVQVPCATTTPCFDSPASKLDDGDDIQPTEHNLDVTLVLDDGECVEWKHGVLSPSTKACGGAANFRAPTLKELICKLDKVTCKLHLQYKIDDFRAYDEESVSWSAWAWSQGKDFEDLAGYIQQGGFGGWIAEDADGSSSFKTKEEAVQALIRSLDGPENIHPSTKPKEYRLGPTEPAIVGPLNCDPHRQCK